MGVGDVHSNHDSEKILPEYSAWSETGWKSPAHFLYLRDPLFLSSSAAYAVNRWALKPHVHSAFLRNWFNDSLLVPCAIPVLFWIFRKCRLRNSDTSPKALELGWIVLVWSILFEAIGPHLVRGTVGDWRDVLMYWAGGIVAWAFWNRHQLRAKNAAV